MRYYTTQRISKRVTVGEEDFHLARRSSERISLATRWIVHQVTSWIYAETCLTVVLRMRKHLMIITS